MSLRHPLARARNHGSAGSGTTHWWHQRLSAMLFLPLIAWLLWFVSRVSGASSAEVAALLAHPVNTGAAILLFGTLFWHAQLGLQVVIEDYVHTGWLELTLQLGVKLLSLVAFLAGALAVLNVTFGTA